MDFKQSAELLKEGCALRREGWSQNGYIVQDEQGKIRFFDHNEPNVFEMTLEDILADDWTQVEKDRWTIVSISYDRELMEGKLFVSYDVCSEQDGKILNNRQIDEEELSKWSYYVNVDIFRTSQYLNEKDIDQVKQVIHI
ncbi:hypothetical protein [Halobacillus yeomjeoni]|uniref:Thoeris anti-defense 2-like domain-containing protein n=1 Tax=Halobacillus yeomjeoni TaxID=311194 RepID=A0A931HWZ2_9BACI|nr:hypothetical protein [Halobacillus yeomjeoni]MBH0230963.1 hypothetical protein [Halobacillus yeomjeoni]